MPDTIDVAVVGLNFGAEFVPIYRNHPAVGRVAIVDQNEAVLHQVGEKYELTDRFTTLDALLATEKWDAVHITTPVTTHGALALKVLQSGRHCASAVPMALSIEEMHEIIRVSDANMCNYMMMETSVYAREFFYVSDIWTHGEIGDLTYFTGSHIQNHDGYPAYWMGFPPMAYVTHALSPALRLSESTVVSVSCHGTGSLEPGQKGTFDNQFPVELGLFRLSQGDLTASITMSWFQTARSYQEGFSVYGTRASIEWPQMEGDPLTKFTILDVEPGLRGRRSKVERIEAPMRADGLPEQISQFASSTSHGGSHPHLVHEFVSSILQRRPASIDARTAAEWTAPGLCAHKSAMAGGDPVLVSSFR